ncbi:unnamed protein product, partial [Mesorhabditis belari]|uniref:Uncharacterized protein n=1 Tax=Mesorhabditis belari TaxID=2138241 RepID=A0AAF3FCP6_9BILA
MAAYSELEFTYGSAHVVREVDTQAKRIAIDLAGHCLHIFRIEPRVTPTPTPTLFCKFLPGRKAQVYCSHVVRESMNQFGQYRITDMSGDATSHPVSHHRFITSQGSAFIIAPVS